MVEALANNKQDIVMLEKSLLFWACKLQMFTVGKLSGCLVQKLDNAREIPGVSKVSLSMSSQRRKTCERQREPARHLAAAAPKK